MCDLFTVYAYVYSRTPLIRPLNLQAPPTGHVIHDSCDVFVCAVTANCKSVVACEYISVAPSSGKLRGKSWNSVTVIVSFTL